MQERRRLPDGFLLMLLSHHFVVAFLVLTTFVVEPAVYNFMQTQKERKPCKIKASAANKRSARRRTRSGGPRTARTGAERRHRTFEPWQGSKKRTIPIWYRSFFKRETGIEPATPSLARRCSTAEPLAHVLQTSYNILWDVLNVNRKSVHLFGQLHIQFKKNK